MKTRTCASTFVLCLLAAAVCFAEDAQLGTWKLNEAKSKMATGIPHNNTVVYEAAGDSIKVTIDGTAPDGKHHTLAFEGKKDGKVSISGRVVVTADGKTRTVTVNATDPTGKKVKGTAVYDKQ